MMNKGFSLIELAIVLIVVGILVAPFIQQYNLYAVERDADETTASFSIVKRAITEFYKMNNRYPCPADITLGPGDAGFGQEACPAPLPGGPAQGACAGGICRAAAEFDTGPDVNGDGKGDPDMIPDPIIIGAVPHVTLNIPLDDTLDGWRKKITYAVTEILSNDALSFDPAQGSVAVGVLSGSPPIYGQVNDAHYVLVSHGENGRGAYSVEGNSVEACPASVADGVEIENCDNDGLFFSDDLRRSLVEGPNYFDDVVMFIQWIRACDWENAEDPVDINKCGAGNVGIGIAMPEEVLDVNGNIRTSNIRADQYCKDDDSCFDPDIITGEPGTGGGLFCDDTNAPVVGIEEGDAYCGFKIPASYVINVMECDPGQYMTGISENGDAICVTP